MRQDTAFYLSIILVSAVLAVLMTHHWLGRRDSLPARDWMVSAWVLLGADILFVIRPQLPTWTSRILPTLLVTIGLVVLLLAAQRTAEQRLHWRRAIVLVVLHAVTLIGFVLANASHSHYRTALNGLVWGALSLASWWYLRKGERAFWKPLVAPANVFLLHAIFMAGRTTLAIWFEVARRPDAAGLLDTIGDLEVSFFVVALYGSLLVADLLTRNAALRIALSEVRTLSGLLPICAWCSKIRDDEGYWNRVDDYLGSHTNAQVTHSICSECASLHWDRDPSPRVPGEPIGGR